MKKLIILLVAFLMLVFCNATASQAVKLSFEGVLVGNQVDVGVVITELGDGGAPSLGGFNIDIGYDPTIIDFTGYVLGPYLGDISLGQAQDLSSGEYSSGVINIYELSFLLGNALVDLYGWGPPYLDDIQPSSFTLATLTFDTLSLGSSPLNISSDFF